MYIDKAWFKAILIHFLTVSITDRMLRTAAFHQNIFLKEVLKLACNYVINV